MRAAAAWQGLKLSADNNTAGLYPVYREVLAERSRVPLEEVQDALRELEKFDWIRMEGRWVWLRNHLLFDPGFSEDNQNQVKGLLRCINGLPKIKLVADFVSYYKKLGIIPEDFEWSLESMAYEGASEGLAEGSGLPDKKETRSVPEEEGAIAPVKFAVRDKDALNKSVIDAYNRIFGSRLGYTPGNIESAGRATKRGYTLDQLADVFQAVKDRRTETAKWCAANNHSFEYLTRPPYKGKQGVVVQGPLDKIPNEQASKPQMATVGSGIAAEMTKALAEKAARKASNA